jgi:hypothetical protein
VLKDQVAKGHSEEDKSTSTKVPPDTVGEGAAHALENEVKE